MTQRARFAGVAAALALLVLPVQAQGPAQAPARAAPAADPAFEAAKAAFEPLPEPDRKGLQDALVWTGDYNSVITGTFGRRTYDALLSYQKRAGNPAPGFPDARMRAAILAAGEMARKAARFTVKPDSASGVMIGVPERLLAKRIPQSGGTRWQSGDGRVTLDTKSFAPEETSLDALFARITAPGSDRKVTYKIKRPDFLVVTGETATGKSYIRYAAAPGGVRGFTIGYDKALGPDLDRLVIAIANSFGAVPGDGRCGSCPGSGQAWWDTRQVYAGSGGESPAASGPRRCDDRDRPRRRPGACPDKLLGPGYLCGTTDRRRGSTYRQGGMQAAVWHFSKGPARRAALPPWPRKGAR